MAQVTSAAVGVCLTVSALLLTTVAMLAGEAGRPRRLLRITSWAGLLLTAAAVVVIVLRFIVLSH